MRATRTYLQLTAPGQLKPGFGAYPGLVIARVENPTAALYRTLYRGVGEAYHWRERWDWTDADVTAHLGRPGTYLFVAKTGTTPAGFYELKQEADGAVEIAYFGLLPAAIGKGLGKHLLSQAVTDAFALGASRVWLHTCTLDHPAALPNYLARGFRPFRTETYEVEG
jgi:GNAT superfamily N-acetyltransferase